MNTLNRRIVRLISKYKIGDLTFISELTKLIQNEILRENDELIDEFITQHACTGKDCPICKVAFKHGYWGE